MVLKLCCTLKASGEILRLLTAKLLSKPMTPAWLGVGPSIRTFIKLPGVSLEKPRWGTYGIHLSHLYRSLLKPLKIITPTRWPCRDSSDTAHGGVSNMETQETKGLRSLCQRLDSERTAEANYFPASLWTQALKKLKCRKTESDKQMNRLSCDYVSEKK